VPERWAQELDRLISREPRDRQEQWRRCGARGPARELTHAHALRAANSKLANMREEEALLRTSLDKITRRCAVPDSDARRQLLDGSSERVRAAPLPALFPSLRRRILNDSRL
jgi:hypothetical protein